MTPAHTLALTAALRLPPDVPGVGRLCQELLAELTGLPIAVPVAEPVRFANTWMIGRRNIRRGVAA